MADSQAGAGKSVTIAPPALFFFIALITTRQYFMSLLLLSSPRMWTLQGKGICLSLHPQHLKQFFVRNKCSDNNLDEYGVLEKAFWRGLLFELGFERWTGEKEAGQVGHDGERRRNDRGGADGTHSHSGSNPQTHPSPPAAAPGPSHSDWWGWPDLGQESCWPSRWVAPLSSLEGRRCSWGLTILRVLQTFCWSSLRAWGIWRGQPDFLTHSLLQPSCFLSLFSHLLFYRFFFYHGKLNSYKRRENSIMNLHIPTSELQH